VTGADALGIVLIVIIGVAWLLWLAFKIKQWRGKRS